MSVFRKVKATNKGGDFQRVPSGNWTGVCAALIDLGTHWQQPYQGQGEERRVRRLLYVWEVEATTEKGDEVRLFIGRDFNVGMDEDGNLQVGKKSNLRALLEGWRGGVYEEGAGVDFEAVVGQNCQVNVVEEKGYSKVGSVTK